MEIKITTKKSRKNTMEKSRRKINTPRRKEAKFEWMGACVRNVRSAFHSSGSKFEDSCGYVFQTLCNDKFRRNASILADI